MSLQYVCSFNLLTTTGAISISHALMVNQTLLELHIGFNQIGDDGITAIAESLSNSSITLLDVRGCSIGFAGVRSFTGSLSFNQNISQLCLLNNPITVDGACLIIKSAIKIGILENITIDSEYWDDDEVKRMLEDDVRNYVMHYM